jgi:hypothetical protein
VPYGRCPEHGGAGHFEICIHLHPEHEGERPVERMVGGMRVCEACVARFELGPFEGWREWEPERGLRERFLQIYDRFYDSDAHTFACMYCLDEHELRCTRAAGQPDPFPVYERTLTGRHPDTIKALEQHITRAVE